MPCSPSIGKIQSFRQHKHYVQRLHLNEKNIIDDGYHNYLVERTELVGSPGIPMMLNLHNTVIPRSLISFDKCRNAPDKRQYVHFYMYDKGFNSVLTATKRYVELLRLFDGVITPDCSMLIGQSPCLQQTSTYFNRAVGIYLQRQGIPVIPNIRWSDERSFEYCFLGVPQGIIVSISTHGCIRTDNQKEMFRKGLDEMIRVLKPKGILVHGHMPDKIFGEFLSVVPFYRYPSQFELTHKEH